MTVAITYSRASIGINAPLVTVETHISNGLPSLNIVGLPETVVKESKDRVRSAILTSHFEFPARRITINLAPAGLPKYGGRYDLPIALGILAASKQIPSDIIENYEFAGELSLSGDLRPITGILPLALGTKHAGKSLILPLQNAEEANLIKDIELLPAQHLLEVCGHFTKKNLLSAYISKSNTEWTTTLPDFSEVKGQYHAKRALEIAATGQHSMLLIGPPGSGKTLLSNCLPGILPPLNEDEAVALAAIQSISSTLIHSKHWSQRPFRSPHHSASSYALIGGGNPPTPGEISLAHNGILFLDELPEFKRQALEALREPLESGAISISRANYQVEYPANFQLVAAMNPCPCGHYGNPKGDCLCLPDQIKKYQSRISGPLLDRIDLQIELQQVAASSLTNNEYIEEASAKILSRVLAGRNRQIARGKKLNAFLTNSEIKQQCTLGSKEQQLMEKWLEQRKISARSYHKLLKIARTIADLAKATNINEDHLKEAFSYRAFEKMRRL